MQTTPESEKDPLASAMPFILEAAATAMDAIKGYAARQGDLSQKGWDEMSEQDKEFVIEGVRLHWVNAALDAASSHANWVAMREAQGWTFGDVRDPIAKTHPNMTAWELLPEREQFKQLIFIGIIRAFANRL